jgi:hypothetical protein
MSVRAERQSDEHEVLMDGLQILRPSRKWVPEHEANGDRTLLTEWHVLKAWKPALFVAEIIFGTFQVGIEWRTGCSTQ